MIYLIYLKRGGSEDVICLLQIKELYKDQCVIDEIPDYPNDYYWFKDEGNHLVGIKKNISTSEKKLLSINF